MSQFLTINLSKSPGTSWGFRLQGGKDFAQPLCIQKVNVGSIAAGAGLQAGDAIVSIGSADALTLRHKEAQDTIVKAGQSFPMVIQRGAMTWKPQVTALSQPKKTAEGPVATQTSLAANQPAKTRAPKGFNAKPVAFGEVNGQAVVNPAYNTPINLYNEDNIAEALSSQSEVLGKGCLGINFRKFDREVALRTDSPTYQLIHGQDAAASGGFKPHKPLPPQQEASQGEKPVFPAAQPGQQGPVSGYSSPVPCTMPAGSTRSVQAPVTKPRPEGQAQTDATVCTQCEKPIIGVFVRIKDKNLHADCFKCNTCGSSLKNVGYYNINDKMYCDVHAKQAARHNPPGPNMVPVTVNPGTAAPFGAMPAAAVKMPVLASTFVPAPGIVSGGSSANPAAFGAPSGGVDVRAHIPKKGPAPAPLYAPAPAPVYAPAPAPVYAPAPAPAPAPSFITPKPASPAPSFITPKPAAAPAPSFITPKPATAPAPAPSFIAPKPVAAPASSPMFGSIPMPKPGPPPGIGSIGGILKPPGMAGKGMSGERTAPKRGKGVMTPAHASRIPICAGCQIQIRGPFVTALGKNWCPDHFHCATESCRKPLIDVGFVEELGKLHCEDCYEKYLAPTCGKCDKRIKGDCLNAVGKQFHPECFCCAYCGKVFGSGAFYLEDGLPYCETDWNDLFTTKCVGCGFPIEAGDRWVEALNNNYHSQCFKCSKCHKNLEGQSFFAKGGKPFCKSHAQRGF